MFRRSAGSLVGALLALLVVATAARAPRIWFPKNRLPLAQPPGSVPRRRRQRMEVAVGLKDAHPAADFNDYTVATNGAYQALPGWDYVSGGARPT